MIALTLKQQKKFVEKEIRDIQMQEALLQSLDILITNNDHNDNAVVARMSENNARKFVKYLETNER